MCVCVGVCVSVDLVPKGLRLCRLLGLQYRVIMPAQTHEHAHTHKTNKHKHKCVHTTHTRVRTQTYSRGRTHTCSGREGGS
mmetsp:Transcript_56698/g.83220  ORF Transcript_56698/g.83220 Transcript_56698/m.83220 type:complete len:81 (-) Transcript_56698:34-276(-)